MVHLSKTSKLDNIQSWSLQALTTCPGSIAEDGDLVDACKGCYATQGTYHFPLVKKVRAENQEDWKRIEWVSEFTEILQKEKYFRWFDSGDMYSLKLARKILEVMKATPHVKHWLPTRMYKFSKFEKIIAEMNSLPNVAVRNSSDSVVGEFTPELHGSTILPTAERVPKGVTLCTAYQNDGKCTGCRNCYDKTVKVIGYPQHGRAMKKIIMMKLAARQRVRVFGSSVQSLTS